MLNETVSVFVRGLVLMAMCIPVLVVCCGVSKEAQVADNKAKCLRMHRLAGITIFITLLGLLLLFCTIRSSREKPQLRDVPGIRKNLAARV